MKRNGLGARILAGAAAGAAGASALNIVTYLDMLLRGRPSSSVPEDDVRKLEDSVSVPQPANSAERKKRSHRETAAGALIGYVVGLGIGALTGALWPLLGSLPRPLVGLLVGGGAMAGSDMPSIVLGTTDPRSWGPASWASDAVPHLAYGLVTVALAGALLSEDEAA